MKEKSFRAGIIGCGGIAAEHIAAYQRNNVEIKALADISKNALENAAEKAKGAKLFDDYKAMLDSGLVDVVSICTPPVAHEEAAVAALERGIHVLCEKPLAHSVAAGKNIVAAAEKSGAALMTAFRHRFIPANLKMKELLVAGEIGKPVFFQNFFGGPAFSMKDKWFSKKSVAGGGALMDTGIHSVDLFRFFMGEVVEHNAVMHRHLDGTDVEDAGILVLKAENGVAGSLFSAWVAGEWTAFIDIMGQAGRMVFHYNKPDEIRVKKQGEDEWRVVPVAADNGFTGEIKNFLDFAAGVAEPECDGRDGLRALEIVCSAYK